MSSYSSSSADRRHHQRRRFAIFSATSCGFLSQSNAWPMRSGGLTELSPLDANDIDVMFVAADAVALTPGSVLQLTARADSRTVLWICKEDGIHAGYTRLIRAADGEYYTRHELQKRFRNAGTSATSMGPAITVPLPADSLYRVPLATKEQHVSFNGITGYDLVPCIVCPQWPDAAGEWRTRVRRNGWPSKSVLAKCVRGGCHFVAAAHQTSRSPDNEFRYSFSAAESTLIQSWLPTQRYIYLQLKKLKGVVCKKVDATNAILCSYHLKTLMLWSCERQPVEFWAVENIVESVRQLVCEMVEWVIDRRCLNYFIPANNMFDHIANNDNLLTLIRELSDVSEQLGTYINISDYAMRFSNVRGIMPHWLLVLGQLILFASSRNHRMAKVVMFELRDLYASLSAQLALIDRLKELTADEQRQAGFAETDGHFLEALRRDDALVEYEFNRMDNSFAAFSQTSSYVDACHRSTSYGKPRRSAEVPHETANTPQQSSRSRGSNYHNEANNTNPIIHVVKAAFRISRLSWYLTMAYRANFHCAVRRDYRTADELCEQTLHAYESGTTHELAVAEAYFRMPLSADWSALFDDEVRAIIGLVTLYDAVRQRACSDTACRDAAAPFISVSPIQFVRYVKVRCQQNLNGVPANGIDIAGVLRHFLRNAKSSFDDRCASTPYSPERY